MLIGVGVSCCISYSIVGYLFVNCSGSIYNTSVGEERAIFCYRLLVIMWFLLFLFVLGIGIDL